VKRALTAVAAAGTLAAATLALPTDGNALPVRVVPAERAEAGQNCHVAYPAEYGYKRMLICAYRY